MPVSKNQQNLDLSKAASGFTPQFDPSKEIVVEDQVPVKGTGLLVFQGLTNTVGTTKETGEQFEFPSAVFAALDQNGELRNISTALNKKTLELTFKALGLEVPYTESDNGFAKLNAKALKNFTKKYVLDGVKAIEMVQSFRGLLYFGTLERKEGKSGVKYYSIDLSSLSPVLEGGETVRAQPLEDTDPDVAIVVNDDSQLSS
ncbi:hypothetical protein [Rivularia sp. PCC 7116]|uniref:hypothetical protein n=1 Tax=Rivularia sp. PCC 7116 TaxID=373994 RepID=UPI0012F8C7B2|nr:hypothetical protein [Rivularia sp. PCC 7116]